MVSDDPPEAAGSFVFPAEGGNVPLGRKRVYVQEVFYGKTVSDPVLGTWPI